MKTQEAKTAWNGKEMKKEEHNDIYTGKKKNI